MIKALLLFVASVVYMGLVGCGYVTEKDLADLRSPNGILKKEAIKRISAKRPFPLSLWARLTEQESEERAIGIMTELLSSGKESMEIQLALIKAFGQLSKSTEIPGDLLTKLLKSDDLRVRYAAVEALGKAKHKRATPELLRLLRTGKDPYPVVWALGEIGASEAIPELNKLLASEEKYLRFNAYKALGKIGKIEAELTAPIDGSANSNTLGLLPKVFKQYQDVMQALLSRIAGSGK